MVNLTFKVNNTDYSGYVERDSYSTSVIPVYSDSITTLDGVEHKTLKRLKGRLNITLNPQNAANTALICSDLLSSPVEVQYHCLQRNVDVTANMAVDTVSADFLSRCLYRGESWNGLESITLTEL